MGGAGCCDTKAFGEPCDACAGDAMDPQHQAACSATITPVHRRQLHQCIGRRS